MEVSAVRCAVQAISETVSQLPLEIIETDESNAKKQRADHPAAKLLGPRGNPNPWTPPSLLIERVTRDALLRRWGGFAEIVRNSDGVPIELHHLDQYFCEVEPRWLEGIKEPSYFVTGPKEPSRIINYPDMLQAALGIRGVTARATRYGLNRERRTLGGRATVLRASTKRG